MQRTDDTHERWRRRLDFAFFLVFVLLVCGIAVSLVAFFNTTSVQMLVVLATLGPLLVAAVALALALLMVEQGRPPIGPAQPGREAVAQAPSKPRRAA
jgi:hypothetical protein